jgi:hypothetical protein
MKKPARRARRKGIITALVAVTIIAVLMIAALSIDGGRILDARRQAKAAADAAARGAAIEMLDFVSGNNPSATLTTVRASAFRIAADNGFANDGTNSVVTVNSPPTSGAYAGQSGFIEVIIESKIDRGFSRLLGSTPLSAYARSVGAGTYVPTQGSVLVLNPKKSNALALGKGSSRLIVNGDVAVNSKNNKPMSIEKGSQIQANNVMVSGKLSKTQSRGLQKNINGQLQTRVPPTPDPYAGLEIPSKGVDRKLGDQKTTIDGRETYNLQPGRYTEDWKFDHNDAVNLAPGTYYLDGKKIDVHDQATMQGSEVTIYSAGKGEMRFHSTGNITLSPPTSGTYAGITLFKDPTAKGKLTFEKDTDLNLSGAIYAPSSMVRFQKTAASFGDDDDESAWNNLDDDLDDALSGDETSSNSMFGASIIANMLKIDKGSTITIPTANLNLQRPLMGLVE